VVELAVSLSVVAVAVFIFMRYRNAFSLPFFWAACFACIYLGLLQLHAQYGGSSYLYAAEGFGMYFLGLLVAELLFFYRPSNRKIRNKHRQSRRKPEDPKPKPPQQPQPTRIRLLFPTLPLNLGLLVSLVCATIVSFVLFVQNGIPIFTSFPALAWIQSTSGIVNRIVTVFGPGCYAIFGLMAWAVHRETGSPISKGMMYLGLGLAISSSALLASKAAAIMVFVWFNILLFYMNKKRELWKTILPLIIIVVPVSAAIVAVRMVSTQGYWETTGIFDTYYHRLTTEAAEPLDFIFKYMNRFGPMHGGAMRREVARIKDQLAGGHKTPLVSEVIYDLLNSESTNSTGLSAALTLSGMGFVEWGMAGMLIYSFLQGVGFGLVHKYLLIREKMDILMLIFWGSIVSYLMAASVGGSVLLGLESVPLSVVPPAILFLPFSILFLLPMARRYRSSADRRIPRLPQSHVHASRGVER
jgi:hypothetical protein